MWKRNKLKLIVFALAVVAVMAAGAWAKRYSAPTHNFFGNVSFVDNLALGNAATDTIAMNGTVTTDIVGEGDTADAFEKTIDWGDPTQDSDVSFPDEDGRVAASYVNENTDIDTAAASTKWTVSDVANWTVDVGTSNSRAGGNTLEFATDNTVDDELEFDNTSVIDLTDFKYLGWWQRNDGGILAADELDADLRSPNDTVITSCGAIQLPAMAQDDWTWVELDISACTGKSRFQKLAIVADTGITANTNIDIGSTVIAYNLSNGHGPVRGLIAEFPVSSGTVTRGQVACWPAIGTEDNGVKTCGANDSFPVGIALTTSTSTVLLQLTGRANMLAGNAIADNADVDVLSGAITIDDAGGIQDSIGFATEAAADAGDVITIRLQF